MSPSAPGPPQTARALAAGLLLALATALPSARAQEACQDPCILSTTSGDLLINSSSTIAESQVLTNGVDVAEISARAASIAVATTGGN